LTSLDDALGSTQTYKYYRKSDNLSKLYTKDASGNEVEVQVGSTLQHDRSKQQNVCKELAVTDDKENEKTCSVYLQDCLAGNNIEVCRDFMKNSKFWGDGGTGAKAEVEKMLPSTARLTLEKFEFKQISVYDSVAKKNLFKSESVYSWLQNLSKNLNSTDYTAISKNTSLLHYLGLLVDKINGSPAILNKNVDSSEETQPYNPNKFMGQFAYKLGIRPKIHGNNFENKSQRFLNTVSRYGIINNILTPKIFVPITMRGGSSEITSYDLSLLDDQRLASAEYENQFKSYKEILNGSGKQIDPNDEKSLKDLIESFKKSEKKMIISLAIIQKYIELMDVFKYNDPKGILSLSNLNEIINNNKMIVQKANKKQDTLLNALQTLSSVVADAVNKNNTVNENNTVVHGNFLHEN
jgi:hypothetical protein